MRSHVTNAQHKEQARNALKNQWGMMAWIVLLNLIISFVVSGIVGNVFTTESTGANIANFLLNNLVFFALGYGMLYAALQVLRGKKAKPEMLVNVFQKEHYIPMLVIHFIQYIVERVVAFVVLLPFLLLFGSTFFFHIMMANGSVGNIQSFYKGNVIWLVAAIVAAFLMIIVSFFISGVFNFAVWTKFDNKNWSGLDCIKQAFQLMRGHFVQYLLLQLSFIGWYFVGALTLGIGLLWIIPYQNVTIASFYETTVAEKEEI
jgi:uncharacterized membrane protein